MKRHKKRHHQPSQKHSADPASRSVNGSAKGGGLFLGIGAVLVAGLAAIVAFYPKGTRSAPAQAPSQIASQPATNSMTPASPHDTGLATNQVADHEHDHSGLDPNMNDTEIAVGLLSRGNEALSQGKLEEAIADYRHALKHDPGSEDIHYNLGIALGRIGSDEEAITHYLEAIRILPDYAEAHNNLGNLLVKQGKYDDALDHFQIALDVNPESASTHNNIGTALARKGKITEATVHFAKAAYLQPAYLEARFNLANAYTTQGRLREAIEEYTEVLRIQPDFTPAMQALAKVRNRQALQSP